MSIFSKINIYMLIGWKQSTDVRVSSAAHQYIYIYISYIMYKMHACQAHTRRGTEEDNKEGNREGKQGGKQGGKHGVGR